MWVVGGGRWWVSVGGGTMASTFIWLHFFAARFATASAPVCASACSTVRCSLFLIGALLIAMLCRTWVLQRRGPSQRHVRARRVPRLRRAYPGAARDGDRLGAGRRRLAGRSPSCFREPGAIDQSHGCTGEGAVAVRVFLGLRDANDEARGPGVRVLLREPAGGAQPGGDPTHHVQRQL